MEVAAQQVEPKQPVAQQLHVPRRRPRRMPSKRLSWWGRLRPRLRSPKLTLLGSPGRTPPRRTARCGYGSTTPCRRQLKPEMARYSITRCRRSRWRVHPRSRAVYGSERALQRGRSCGHAVMLKKAGAYGEWAYYCDGDKTSCGGTPADNMATPFFGAGAALSPCGCCHGGSIFTPVPAP